MNTKTIGYLTIAASAGTFLSACKLVSDIKEISENVEATTGNVLEASGNVLETSRNAYKIARIAAGIAGAGTVLAVLWLIRRKR